MRTGMCCCSATSHSERNLTVLSLSEKKNKKDVQRGIKWSSLKKSRGNLERKERKKTSHQSKAAGGGGLSSLE